MVEDIKIEEDATEITKKVETREGDFEARNTRMDSDFERWNLTEKGLPTDYDITTKALTGAHETDVEIVSNDLRTYSDNVQAILSDAEMQIFVRMAEAEGEDKRDDIGKLERLFRFALAMADERLRRMLLPPLRESLIWYSLVRGWVAGRFLIWKDTSRNAIFDFLSLDPRWLTYEVGSEGLMWTGYKTFRPGAALKAEYNHDAKDKEDNPVIDYWKQLEKGKISNAVICDETFLYGPKTYDMLSFPILVTPVATRPPITGSTGSEKGGYGDSIFAPARSINEIRNRFASIVATHANLLAKQPVINYYGKKGIQLKDTVYLAEAVLNLPAGENKLEPAPMKEISPTVVSIMNWLSEQMERATLPNIPVTTPPPSGTLYNLVQEAGNRVFNPQLKNLSYFYADILRLTEEQLVSNKIKVDVRQEEKRKYFEVQVTPVDLKKPHMIKVEFTARTPWTQLDTYQIADMAKRLGLPDAFIHEYILKLPDPKGLGDLSAIELFEHSPKGAMLRAISALMKTGRQDEAEDIMRDLYAMAMAEEMGETPPPEEEAVEEPPVETPPVVPVPEEA